MTAQEGVETAGSTSATSAGASNYDGTRRESALFESTVPFGLFDYFRVPYLQVDARNDGSPGLAQLRTLGEASTLRWTPASLLALSGRRPAQHHIDSLRIFGAVASNAQMQAWLRHYGGTWQQLYPLRDESGAPAGAVWQGDDGSICLPFDPNEAITNYLLERYLTFSRRPALNRLTALARGGYYRARPALPRALQLSLRRSFSRLQAKREFPRWPTETALHDLYAFLFRLARDIARRPIPYIGAWPRPWSWSLVLTHDVESQVGLSLLPRLLEVELTAGYRSSWNFVPKKRYTVSEELLQTLRAQGFEIGVHGLYHDGRDLESLTTLRRRLPEIRTFAERWNAEGFRSPATLRSAELMPLLGFDYDSSFPDTAPFEPQAGGCCTWLPYMIGDLVELPITLEQDHTLFELMGHQDGSAWLEKASFLRERGGMALVITHPDYAENPALLASYRGLLNEFREDESAWKALPVEVSTWWRRRAASKLEEVDGKWRVTGPAENDAQIAFANS
jgi:hypothetical protein